MPPLRGLPKATGYAGGLLLSRTFGPQHRDQFVRFYQQVYYSRFVSFCDQPSHMILITQYHNDPLGVQYLWQMFQLVDINHFAGTQKINSLTNHLIMLCIFFKNNRKPFGHLTKH
jgi:hypothetical protein